MRTATMKEYNNAKAEFISRHYGEEGYREYSNLDGKVIYKELVFMDAQTGTKPRCRSGKR